MKIFVLIATFISTAVFAGEPANTSVQVDGHKLEVQIVTRIETNPPAPPQSPWICCITNSSMGFYYLERRTEQPFPRTTTSDELFDVTSNTYCNVILDGKTTNTLTSTSKKLGSLKRSKSTVITTQTNSVSSETFTPEK
jgi:hypothetical protein